MKKFLLVTASLLSMTIVAAAADIPSRRAAPMAPVFAVPVFTWSGFYVGVNAGYGFSNSDNNVGAFVAPFGFVAGSNGNGDNGGFIGGGQIGYNFQVGQIVFGVETDLQYADLKSSSIGFIPAPGIIVTGNRGLDYFGTVRARIGFAFDRALIYATGGLAYGGGGGGNNFQFGGGDDSRVGYAVGGGVEYAFTNNLTVKLEGLYVGLDGGNNTAFFVTPARVATPVFGTGKSNTEFGVVRVGMNYKF